MEFESIELAHLVSMRDYFAAELKQLQPMADAGLVEIEPDALQVTAAGWYLVRAVAMVFDRYLREDRRRVEAQGGNGVEAVPVKFSKIV
jgi:oxygen-independent coproporphyrinogen-3 oxidase